MKASSAATRKVTAVEYRCQWCGWTDVAATGTEPDRDFGVVTMTYPDDTVVEHTVCEQCLAAVTDWVTNIITTFDKIRSGQ